MDKRIEGIAYYGAVTKQLLLEIPSHTIVIIKHEDVDLLAAEEIVRKNVLAVINVKKTVTGNLPRSGISHLMDHCIPIYDLLTTNFSFPKKMHVRIENDKLLFFHNGYWKVVGSLKRYTKERVHKKIEEGIQKFPHLFMQFAKNSLHHAHKEITMFVEAVEKLEPLPALTGKNVFVVARGPGVIDDINFLKPIFRKKEMIILAVDGAANMLLKIGVLPHYVIGDMDSLHPTIFDYPSQFIVHSYMNGDCPGEEWLKKHHNDYMIVPFPGMSEDLAIMLACISGANYIFTLGCRTSTIEFVEKGRKGMGSTILTRMYSGHKICDCKNVRKLFPFISKRKDAKHFEMDDILLGTNDLEEL